jgi:beta-glucosidase
MTTTFPDGFQWGTGTSAYQVEGAWDADGKVPSIWDTFQHTTLRTPDGSSGDVAIDQYHRLDGDLDILRDLGASTHRFSASWPRVISDAAGTINTPGLDYYDRVVDGLLARNIRPALNLFHWDTPQWMEDLGGMMTREFADHFATFASAVAGRLGDRVAEWYTMNEPTNPSVGGYVAGFLPPHQSLGAPGLASVHHLLLAHGRAVQAIRAQGVTGDVGTIVSMSGISPATTHPDDVRAAERADYFEGRVFLDPMLGHGHLPELAATLGDIVQPGDLETIAQPLDVLGLNWYSRFSAAAPERAAVHLAETPPQGGMFTALAPLTAKLGFAVVPTPGLRWGGGHRQLTPGGFRAILDWMVDTYPDHPTLVITENGVGGAEQADASGHADDTERVEYLSWAVAELADAVAHGARVRGYHVWSSFDNFQWMSGFSQRYGLVHVDHDTQVRTPKPSFAWFRELIATGTIPASTGTNATGDHSGVEVGGVLNARGIGGLRTVDNRRVRDGLLFRTAGLHNITDEGTATLSGLGVSTVLDLRGDEEASRWPSLRGDAVTVSRLPLHHGRLSGQDAAVGLDGVYTSIVRDSGELIVAGIRAIAATTEGASLVHCTAGKDRTGVFVAVFLAALGVTDADIVRTYAESASRLGDDFVEQVARDLFGTVLPAEVAADLNSSTPDRIVAALALIRHGHGTVAAYLRHHGLTDDELTALRQMFLESEPGTLLMGAR